MNPLPLMESSRASNGEDSYRAMEEPVEQSVEDQIHIQSSRASNGEDYINPSTLQVNILSMYTSHFMQLHQIIFSLQNPDPFQLQDMTLPSYRAMEEPVEQSIEDQIQIPSAAPEAQEIQYHVLARATQRGKPLLVDSAGYTYVIKMQTLMR